jgi:LacI family transcriptional regulator
MATIKEVANLAGVSVATVSHVINDTRFVSEAVRKQVYQAMNELGYRPNTLARSLRRGQTQTLGLILPDSANPFFAEVGRSIERVAFESGYNVILGNTENDFEKESLYLDVLINKQVDGIIFVASGERSDSLRQLMELALPAVVMDREFPGLEMDVVLSDNHQGGYLATQHLLSLGHRQIGCIAGVSRITPSALRVAGYQQALQEGGVAVDPTLMMNGDFHPESGFRLAGELLARPNPPTAIFACNDLMAMGVLRAAAECGRRVPDDLAVVGYDDIELASFTNPPLTTIRQPKLEMGAATLQFLLSRIKEKRTNPQRTLLPVSLVVRGSSVPGGNH